MKIKKTVLYTYLVSVCFAVGYYFLNKYSLIFFNEKYPDKIRIFQTLLYFPFAIIYMWIPGIIALIFSKKEKFKIPIFKKLNKYYLYAIIIPIIFTILTIFVSMIFAKIDFTYLILMIPPSFNFFDAIYLNYIMYFLFLLLILLFLGISINTFAALGEELFWRGYLFQKLKKLNFWHSSLIIGVLWGVWHYPIIILFGHNYPNFKIIGLIWMVVMTILSTPLYMYLRKQGKSVLVPCIFHGIFNGVAPYSIVFFQKPNHLLVGATGVSAFIVWIFINIVLFLNLRKKAKK